MAQKILVVDDNKYHCEFIAAAAELFNWHCITTMNVPAFFQNLTPDTALILLDLMMPDVDGAELLTLLAARQCRARIVLMSGVGIQILNATDLFARSLGLSIAGHLRKPFRLAELQSIVDQSLESTPGTLSDLHPRQTSSDPAAPLPDPQTVVQSAHA